MKNFSLSIVSSLLSLVTALMPVNAQMPPDRFGAQDQRPGGWGGGGENRPAPVLPGQAGPVNNGGALGGLDLSNIVIHKPGADPADLFRPREVQPQVQPQQVQQEASKPSVSEMTTQLAAAGVNIQQVQNGSNPTLNVMNAHALMSGGLNASQINLIAATPLNGGGGVNLQTAVSLQQSGVTGNNIVALINAGAGDAASGLASQGVNINAVMANGGVASIRAADRLEGRGVTATSINTMVLANVNLSAMAIPGTQSGTRDLTDMNRLLGAGVPPQNVMALAAEANRTGDFGGTVFANAAAILRRDGAAALNAIIVAAPPAGSSLSLELSRVRYDSNRR